MCRQVLHKRGDAGTPGVVRSARCSPAGRQGSGLQHPPREGTEVPVARHVRRAPPAPGSRPRKRREGGTRSGPGNRRCGPTRVRPRGAGPPGPHVGPTGNRLRGPPLPRRTQQPWLPKRTQLQCRCGTAHSRRKRRTTPYGSSHGTCATASSRQTGPSGTRSDSAGDRRLVPTRSTSSPACYPGRGALPSCSRKQGSPPGRRRCTWPRRSGTRGTPPSSAAGWRTRQPVPPREGEASSTRSAASTWQSTRC